MHVQNKIIQYFKTIRKLAHEIQLSSVYKAPPLQTHDFFQFAGKHI